MSQSSKLWHCDIWKCHKMSHFFKSWYKATFTFFVWIGLGTALTHLYMWHASCVCLTWLICICAMTDSFMWHGSFTHCQRGCRRDYPKRRIVRLIYLCVMTHPQSISVIADVTIHSDMSWLTHIYNMTHSYKWHDSFVYEFVCVTWLIRCDVTYMRHDSFEYETHLFMYHDSSTIDQRYCWRNHPPRHVMTHSYIWDMTHLYVWHDSFIHVSWLIHNWWALLLTYPSTPIWGGYGQ